MFGNFNFAAIGDMIPKLEEHAKQLVAQATALADEQKKLREKLDAIEAKLEAAIGITHQES